MSIFMRNRMLKDNFHIVPVILLMFVFPKTGKCVTRDKRDKTPLNRRHRA